MVLILWNFYSNFFYRNLKLKVRKVNKLLLLLMNECKLGVLLWLYVFRSINNFRSKGEKGIREKGIEKNEKCYFNFICLIFI